MANTRQELGKAFELIRQDQLEEAIQIVKPITEAEPENADAWWLLANAASEPRDARRALVNALKINPTYPKARDLLDKLNEMHPPRDDELMMMMELEDVEPDLPGADMADPFDDLDMDSDDTFKLSDDAKGTSEIDDLFGDINEDLDDAFDDDDDFGIGDDDPFASLLEEDEKKAARAARGGGGRRMLLLLVLLLIIIVVAVVVFVGMGGSDDDASEPAIADNTDTGPDPLAPVAPETINAENAEQLEAVRGAVESQAQSSIAPDATAFFVAVDGGYSLLVRVCSEPTPALPRVAVDGMRLVAGRIGNTPAVQDDLAMVGVSVQDCARGDDTLYRAMSPMAAVLELANNTSAPNAFTNFQQSWVVES